jgi:hypothetical protein
MCHRLNLKNKRVDFIANLIVLDSKGIAVKTSFKLTTLDRNELEYIAKSVVIAKVAANHVKLNQLDVSQGLKVPVINKFSNVFFEELSVMQPDHDIEYVIE